MPHTGWGSEARQQVEFQPAVFWLPIYSITAVLSVWLPLLLSLLPLAPPPPLPLKGTLLRWTVCVTRWAGHTQWDTQLSGCPCVYTCVSVFAVSTLGSLSSLHMKMYFKWCVLSPLSLHTHTHKHEHSYHISVILLSGEQREEVELQADGYVCLPICPWHDQLISGLIHCHHGLITFPFKMLMVFYRPPSSFPSVAAFLWCVREQRCVFVLRKQ